MECNVICNTRTAIQRTSSFEGTSMHTSPVTIQRGQEARAYGPVYVGGGTLRQCPFKTALCWNYADMRSVTYIDKGPLFYVLPNRATHVTPCGIEQRQQRRRRYPQPFSLPCEAQARTAIAATHFEQSDARPRIELGSGDTYIYKRGEGGRGKKEEQTEKRIKRQCCNAHRG